MKPLLCLLVPWTGLMLVLLWRYPVPMLLLLSFTSAACAVAFVVSAYRVERGNEKTLRGPEDP